MAVHRFRLADGVDEPRVAIGARNVDVVFGQPADDSEETVDVFETEDEEVAAIFGADPELLEHTVVSDETGEDVSPEDYAAELAVKAERERQEQIEAEGRVEADKVDVATGDGVDVTAAAADAAEREEWLLRAEAAGLAREELESVETADLPERVLQLEDAQR